jgi:hypothetical protein
MSFWILAKLIVIRRAFKAQRMIHMLIIEYIGTGCRCAKKRMQGAPTPYVRVAQ